MEDALLGADGTGHLVVGIQGHIIILLVVFSDFPAQITNTAFGEKNEYLSKVRAGIQRPAYEFFLTS